MKNTMTKFIMGQSIKIGLTSRDFHEFCFFLGMYTCARDRYKEREREREREREKERERDKEREGVRGLLRERDRGGDSE